MTIVHTAGEHALLLDVAEGRAAEVAERIAHGPLASLVTTVIPASRSVLILAEDAVRAELVRALLQNGNVLDLEDAAAIDCGRDHHVPTRYGGLDLEDAAAACGLSAREFAIAHADSEHRVGFFGFAPGFAYINGLNPRLELPRRDSPRTLVEAGMVAVAARQSVIYPGGTPGGWHLIGKTDFVAWDLQADPPTPLAVGDRIVFEPIGPLP